MGIEKDIHQTQFRNHYQKAIVNMIFSSNWLNERIKKVIDDGNITMQQYNILRIVLGSKMPISTMQIRERMLDKMSDTSRIVDRLVAKGLVVKAISKSDKRLVDVSITDAGKKLLETLDKRNHEIDEILYHLTEDETIELNRLLDKMRNHH
jgi:DNA-binding MarR family transcriptional regulator